MDSGSTRSGRAGLGRAWRRRRAGIDRWFFDSERALILTLYATGAVCAFFMAEYLTTPVALLLVPMVIGNSVLSPRSLPAFVLYLLGLLGVVIVVQATQQDIPTARYVGIGVDILIGLIILSGAIGRATLGVALGRGESMLVDLRDRINKQGEIPELPPDWYAESVLRAAGGTQFAGDFFVARRSLDGKRVEVAVVDVSGKGVQAGTRSLLLSGAFGGLIGALPPAQFLPAANEYLLAQDWAEGFATALHLSLDLLTGDYELRTAGHPPAVQLHSGSGRWEVQSESEGPVLGLTYDATFTESHGRMRRGDVLLMYTDGLVETPSRDIYLGIDRLQGEAERLLRTGVENGARRLIDRTGSRNDDRALLLLHRR
jgi:Stage II sporulation protein E (SpoIIE)